MENVRDELDFFKNLAKYIAQQFGSRCEVVLHDYSNNYDGTIVLIENGHVTGREVGGCSTNLFYINFKDGMHDEIGTYMNTTETGRTFKSSTTLIRNSAGKVIGSLCINFDVTELVITEDYINNIIGNNNEEKNTEVFTNNINELLEKTLANCQNMIGISPIMMSREEKIRAIKYLDNTGIFLISKAGKRVCDFLNISKFTLYNYLDEVRNGNGSNALAAEED